MKRLLLVVGSSLLVVVLLAGGWVTWRLVTRGDEDRSGLDVTAGEVEADPDPPIHAGGGDCGWSVPLHDGQSLWVVCDGGGFSNLAGLAPADAPAEPVFGGELVSPSPDLDCEGADGDRVAWITGLAAQPREDSTTVVALVASGCRGELVSQRGSSAAGGVAVLEYRGAAPGTPLRVDSVRYDVWPARWEDGTRNIPHVSGGVTFEGHVYAYACGSDYGPFDPSGPDGGRCTVARADVDDRLGVRSSWTYWDGEGWLAPECDGPCNEAEQRAVEARQAAIDLPIPAEAVPLIGGLGQFVPESFPVRWDPQREVLVSAAPQSLSAIDDMWVRSAQRPEGPWSLPAEIGIDCPQEGGSDDAFECRHHAPHPEVLDDPDRMVFSHFDGTTSPETIHTVEVDLRVERTG